MPSCAYSGLQQHFGNRYDFPGKVVFIRTISPQSNCFRLLLVFFLLLSLFLLLLLLLWLLLLLLLPLPLLVVCCGCIYSRIETERDYCRINSRTKSTERKKARPRCGEAAAEEDRRSTEEELKIWPKLHLLASMQSTRVRTDSHTAVHTNTRAGGDGSIAVMLHCITKAVTFS